MLLWSGFNLLLRGYGSKKALLERFAREALVGALLHPLFARSLPARG